ncbi:Mitochondrial import receptor subunit TOM22 [Parelaphostrongylus tenuis]|uniref:Mitochondrial import receptor subunit TOM22 homolog n=1 Tax=Parelaphostrongylus tenuis TaxID=148309 RepID=A0AAD5WJ92_PARTN|nr:Mitochondrial import receptor subunit TOM22 [Parelaphostrongylus tenuis]
MAQRGRDEFDDIPDDELEETILERLEGLGEMMPPGLRKAVSNGVSWSWWGAKSLWYLARQGIWIAATTSLIMFMPYVIEKERSDLEKTQAAQQRQMLLGPSAAVQAAKQH